jgi:L-alanine-DL-glutamate epimerase-like enolase superfamily enzyme
VRSSTTGSTGLGEASPSHYYGESAALVERRSNLGAALGDDPFALEAIERRFDDVLRGHGAARAAIEMALHDWIGKKLGLPVWKLLGSIPRPRRSRA